MRENEFLYRRFSILQRRLVSFNFVVVVVAVVIFVCYIYLLYVIYLAYNDSSIHQHRFYIFHSVQRHMLNHRRRYTYRCAPDSVDFSCDNCNAWRLELDMLSFGCCQLVMVVAAATVAMVVWRMVSLSMHSLLLNWIYHRFFRWPIFCGFCLGKMYRIEMEFLLIKTLLWDELSKKRSIRQKIHSRPSTLIARIGEFYI